MAGPTRAKSVANCFLSSNGENVLDLLEEALDMSEEAGVDVEIRPFDQGGTYTYFVTGERGAPVGKQS